MLSDQEFHVLVKLAEIPEHKRIADKSRLFLLYGKQLHSPTAQNVCSLLVGGNHSSRLARAWHDLVLRSAGESR